MTDPNLVNAIEVVAWRLFCIGLALWIHLILAIAIIVWFFFWTRKELKDFREESDED